MNADFIGMTALWGVVLVIAYSFLTILRHNIAQAGRLHQDHMGIAIGERFPLDDYPALKSRQSSDTPLPSEGTVVLMTNFYCDACKRLYEVLDTMQRQFPRYRFVIFMTGAPAEAVKEQLGLHIPVASVDDFSRFRMSAVPFGFFVSADGLVRAKGIVNTEEHVKTLIAKGAWKLAA